MYITRKNVKVFHLVCRTEMPLSYNVNSNEKFELLPTKKFFQKVSILQL